MPPDTRTQAEAGGTASIAEVRDELSSLYGEIAVETSTHARVSAVFRAQKIVVHVPETLLAEDQRDTCMVQSISAIETLQCEASFRRDPSYGDAVATYDQYRTVPAYGLFYRVLFQHMALHRPHIPPIYYEKFATISKAFLRSIGARLTPTPKHIQFLLGLMDEGNATDQEVIQSLAEIRNENIVNFIIDPRQPNGQKLQSIQANILPVYEYFLRQDKEEWKPRKPKEKKSNDETPVDQVEEEREKIKKTLDPENEKKSDTPKQPEDEGDDDKKTEEVPEEKKKRKKKEKPEEKPDNEEDEKIDPESAEPDTEENEQEPPSSQPQDPDASDSEQAEEPESSNDEDSTETQPDESDTESTPDPGPQPEDESEQPQGESEGTQPEDAEQPGESGGEGGGGSEQDTPDYQDEYSTPEGGKFDKDPDGKKFKIEISPPLKGYYVSDQKSYFDRKTKKWANHAKLQTYSKTTALEQKRFTMSATLKGSGLKSLPLPQGYAFDVSTLKYTGSKPTIYRDQNGAFYMQFAGTCEFSMEFGKEQNEFQTPPIPEDTEQLYTGSLGTSGETAIKQAKQGKDNLEKARVVRDHIRSTHFYPPGKNSAETMDGARSTQAALVKNSTGATYIQALDASKHLECFSAATLMAAMLRALGVPARVATGHHIQSLNASGKAEINSGNGHGWVLVWDSDTNTWVRFDATPDKDPSDAKNTKDPKEQKKEEQKKKKAEKAENADDGGEDSEGGEASDEGEGGEQSDGESGESGDSGDSSEGGEQSGEGQKQDGDQEGDSEGGKSEEGDESKGKGEGEDEEGEKSEESEPGEGEKETSDDGGDAEGEGGQSDADSDENEEGEETEDFDSEEEFDKMYEELSEDIAEKPAEKEVQKAIKELDRQNQPPPEVDADKRDLGLKYPGLDKDQLEDLVRFVKEFRKEQAKIAELKNPGFVDGTSDNATLLEELRSIFDRIISRSIRQKDVPRFPVVDGNNPILVNPVRLHLDTKAGLAQSPAFMIRTQKQYEELKVTKVRRHKVLDGSGSMTEGSKVRMQQQIEVLENTVTAEKQVELDDLSNRLNRDLRFETETWQFGVQDEKTGLPFSRLKALSSEFTELEQAAVWELSGRAVGGTNDADPLEAIYKMLMQEDGKPRESDSVPTTLERIRAGFLVREINAHTELEGREFDLNVKERAYFHQLHAQDPLTIFQWLTRFIPSKKVTAAEQKFFQTSVSPADAAGRCHEWLQTFADSKQLNSEERAFFSQLSIEGKSLSEVYAEWLQVLTEKYRADLEPILEIIEVSSDGGSNNPAQLQNIVSTLRGLGIIVIAYGLGSDGNIVEQVYANEYNPLEGGHFCKNLLDYPRNKAEAWKNILDKV